MQNNCAPMLSMSIFSFRFLLVTAKRLQLERKRSYNGHLLTLAESSKKIYLPEKSRKFFSFSICCPWVFYASKNKPAKDACCNTGVFLGVFAKTQFPQIPKLNLGMQKLNLKIEKPSTTAIFTPVEILITITQFENRIATDYLPQLLHH